VRDRHTELAALRPTIPVEIGDAIARALALTPADRFQTAADFAAALAVPTGMYTPRSVLARRRRRIGLGMAGAAVVGALAVALLPKVFGAGLDRSLYVVLPFGHRNGAAPALLDGDQCESALYDAFSRWSDVRVVGEPQAHDAWLRRGDNARSFASALAVARTVRAGMLVWGEVWGLGDSVFVRAGLYDVRASGAALITRTVRIARGDTNIGATFNALADSLLLGRAHTALAVGGAGGTRVFAAWLAYDAGHAARNAWDLDAARQSFRRAVELDPGYPHANLWLAQVMDWQGEPSPEWRGYAAAAHAAAAGLSRAQRQSAAALLDLADGRFVEACGAYRRLVARDSLDFTAWFGLGDCNRFDRLVVRDAASPSTWRFRGSYATAIASYARALEVIPSSHRAFGGTAYQRLARLFVAEPSWLRGGYALTPDTLAMAAAPGLDHDTLSFVPYPLTEILAAKPGTYPATQASALAYGRETLRRLALAWVAAFPNSAIAHETLGRVLESNGNVREDLPEEQSALTAVRRARAVAQGSETELRLAIAETRLLVKVGQFARARQLADSVLGANSDSVPVVAWRLAPLAALVGRVDLASRLLRGAASIDTVMTETGQFLTPPLALRDAALGLLAYAAFGAPQDSLLVIRARLERLAKSWAPAADQEALRRATLDEPARLAFFETGLWSVHRPPAQGGAGYLLGMQFALAHGDRDAIREEFRRLGVIRSDVRPGEVSIDATYLEARTLLALGDTAAATHLLDLSLEALPGLGTELLDRVPEPATLVRAMALRAGLAARAQDTNTRRRWAGAVQSLWMNADPALRPAVDSMQRMSGPS
jgi:tetratricopeptide (TPR) repeat protein